MKDQLCVGVIGAGAISEIYLKNMTTRFPALHVKAVAAKHLENAQKRAEQFGLLACTTEELLADPEIELVVNLTPMSAHYSLIKAALEAGKHVYTEKTLTGDLASAAELMALAREKGLYLGSAPDTFLGAMVQTAKAALEAGQIGEVTGFLIGVNRDLCLLLNALPFLREKGPGICFDFAVYHITALTELLGAVSTVASFTTWPKPYKHIFPNSPDFGKDLVCPNESRVSAILRMESGVTGTVMMDGDSVSREQTLFRIYGTKGILELGDPNQFGPEVRVLVPPRDPRVPAEYETVPPVNEFRDNSRGLGVSELAGAILRGRRSAVDAGRAYHVMEVLAGLLESGESGNFVHMQSRLPKSE